LLLPLREFGIMSAVMALFYLFQTPVNSMLDSLTLLAADRMNRSFPSIRMFGSLGYAICAVIFGYLLKAYGSDLTIILTLGTVTVSLVFSLLVADFQASVRKFEFGGLWIVLRRRETFGFFAVIMLVSVSHRLNDGFLAVAMRDLGASDTVVGVASLVSSVSEIPVFFFLAKYGHRFREFSLLAVASFMYIVRMLLLSVVTEPWGFVAIQAMHSVTFGIFYVTSLRCLQSIIPDEYRSSGQAMFTVVWMGIAGLLAGTLGGWLYDAFGVAVLFRVGAVFALAGCAGFLLLHFRRTAL
jgi:MFS transporter, PPP family, 3-phenylpropionic acid transporter